MASLSIKLLETVSSFLNALCLLDQLECVSTVTITGFMMFIRARVVAFS